MTLLEDSRKSRDDIPSCCRWSQSKSGGKLGNLIVIPGFEAAGGWIQRSTCCATMLGWYKTITYVLKVLISYDAAGVK